MVLLDDSNNVLSDITIVSIGCSVSFTVQGKVKPVFIGWDTSNVDMKNPEITEYGAGNRKVMRYDNSEEMYATLFSLQNDSCECIIDMETFENMDGWIHGFFDMKKNTYEIAMTITKDDGIPTGTILKPCHLVSNSHLKGIHDLGVPYRSQWELLPDYYKASKSCGPASAAMIEEWYDGDHPSLLDIWNWHPADNGWYQSDLEGYLESHTSFSFFSVDYSSSLESCKNYCKGKLQNWPVAIMIKGHSGDNHWVVMRGWIEEWFVQAFTIHNPSMGLSNVHLHYYGLPWWLYPNDRSFEIHAWEHFGHKIKIVW